MKKFILRILLNSVMAAILCLSGSAVAATGNNWHKIAGGMGVYLGVLPAELLQERSEQHPESSMHNGVPAGGHSYHVMVALFGSESGKRLTDANVKATVAELGITGSQKRLEPMHIENTITYGNYFDMPNPGPYRIQIVIQRPGSPHPITVEFEYWHSRPAIQH